MKQYIVYILTNKYKTTLYIGVTNNLQRRLDQHYFDSTNTKSTFAGKYNCIHLIYYESYNSPGIAIQREKELKKWRRSKKNKLISEFNPTWTCLNNQFL